MNIKAISFIIFIFILNSNKSNINYLDFKGFNTKKSGQDDPKYHGPEKVENPYIR
jgi:hypothetical protein